MAVGFQPVVFDPSGLGDLLTFRAELEDPDRTARESQQAQGFHAAARDAARYALLLSETPEFEAAVQCQVLDPCVSQNNGRFETKQLPWVCGPPDAGEGLLLAIMSQRATATPLTDQSKLERYPLLVRSAHSDTEGVYAMVNNHRIGLIDYLERTRRMHANGYNRGADATTASLYEFILATYMQAVDPKPARKSAITRRLRGLLLI